MIAWRFSMRCLRSCAPFSCGEDGRMRWCTIPSCIQKIFKNESPSITAVAHGTPLSVRIAGGKSYSRNICSKIGFASSRLVERNP